MRWPWVLRSDFEERGDRLAEAYRALQAARERLNESEDERKRLLEALITSMQPPRPVWSPASPEQAAAREQQALKVLFEGKDGERVEGTAKPYPAEFPAIG